MKVHSIGSEFKGERIEKGLETPTPCISPLAKLTIFQESKYFSSEDMEAKNSLKLWPIWK